MIVVFEKNEEVCLNKIPPTYGDSRICHYFHYHVLKTGQNNISFIINKLDSR